MRLRGEVHDCVDLQRTENVIDEVGRSDVALDKLVVRRRAQLGGDIFLTRAV